MDFIKQMNKISKSKVDNNLDFHCDQLICSPKSALGYINVGSVFCVIPSIDSNGICSLWVDLNLLETFTLFSLS